MERAIGTKELLQIVPATAQTGNRRNQRHREIHKLRVVNTGKWFDLTRLASSKNGLPVISQAV
jgi:hypothetical protein